MTPSFQMTGSYTLPFHPVPSDASWTGFLLRFVYGLPFICTLTVTHDSTTNTTYALIFGIETSHITAFLTRLKLLKHHAYQPYLIPVIITSLALTRLEHFSSVLYEDYPPLREELNCNLYFLPAHGYKPPDVTEMPRKLTALANAIASNTASITATSITVDVLDEQLGLLKMRDDDVEGRALVLHMRDLLRHMRQVTANTRRRNEYVKESVQAQVQMVRLSFYRFLLLLLSRGLTNNVGLCSSCAKGQRAEPSVWR
jgi:hypothetical protein